MQAFSRHIKVSTLLRCQTRFYRVRRTSLTSHILGMNNLAKGDGYGKTIDIKVESEEETKSVLKKLGFDVNANGNNNFTDKLLLDYLKFTKSSYNRSTKNWNKLRKSLNDSSIMKNDKEKFGLLFEFLLEESNIEINQYQKLGLEGLVSSKLETQSKVIENEEEDSTAMYQEYMLSKELQNPKIPAFPNFNFILNILNSLVQKMQTTPITDMPVTIDHLVSAFETSKLIPFATLKTRGIYLSGSLLYATNKVRLDPVNESFFINSLVNYGKFKKAASLFTSNKEKVSQRWWNEMGMMIYLSSNSLKSFDKLLIETDKKFKSFPYLSPKILLFGIKKMLYINDCNSVKVLIDRFIDVFNSKEFQNLEQFTEHKDKRGHFFKSENQAYDFLNEEQPLSINDISKVISYLTYKQNTSMLYRVLTAIIESDKLNENDFKYLIKSNKLNLLAYPSQFVDELKMFNNNSRTENSQSLHKFQKILEETKTQININNNFPELFYDDFKSLIRRPALNQLIYEFITDSEKENEVSYSKKIYQLMKFLLSNGEYDKAKLLLEKLETNHTGKNLNVKGINKNDQDSLNAHHYALFIEYYYLKCKNGERSKVKTYTSKVTELITRLEDNNIELNSIFISKLLRFYTDCKDFNNSFQVINQLLASKINKQEKTDTTSVFYNRRIITKPLYFEICRAYLRYYRYFISTKERFTPKSNLYSWNSMISKLKSETHISPAFSHRAVFSILTEGDTVLFDQSFYNIFIKTFMLSGDWIGLTGIIYYVHDKYGLELTKETKQYILKGLKPIYVDHLSGYKIGDLGTKNNERIAIATEKVNLMIKNQEILFKPLKEQFSADSIIEEILHCLKYTSADITSVLSAIENAYEELNVQKSNISTLMKLVNN